MEFKKIKDLEGYKVEAADGIVGKVSDFHFDDERWVIRYLVVNTGGFIFKNEVLLSPASFKVAPNWDEKKFPVFLTKEMIENSPTVGTKKPVSREMELQLINYYRWPVYWTVPVNPMVVTEVSNRHEINMKKEANVTNPHLRSCNEVIGYQIHASDGEIGYVKDMIIDNKDFQIQYLVVETGNWLMGKKVLLMPEWLEKVIWTDKEVTTGLSKSQIEQAPLFVDESQVTQKYHETLHLYYEGLLENIK